MFEKYFHKNPLLVRRIYGTLYAVAFLYAAIHVFRFATLATDENIFADRKNGLTITEILPEGASDLAGLKIGDIITHINGKTFRNAQHADSILRSGQIGKEINYTIRRNGIDSVYKVRLAQAGLELNYLFRVIASILFFGVGISVVLTRPLHPIARLFSTSFLLFGLFIPLTSQIRGYIYDDVLTSIWPILVSMSLPFAVAGIAYTNLFFPVRMSLEPYPKWFKPMFIVFPVLQTTVIFFTRGDGMVYLVAFVVYVLTLFALPPMLFRKKLNGEWRAKMKYIRISVLIMVASVVVMLSFQPIKLRFTLAQYFFLGYSAIPLAYAYTIVRYRIFDIYLVVRRSVIYSTLMSVVIIAFVVSLFVTVNLLPALNLDLPAIRFTTRSVELVNLRQLPDPERTHLEKSMLISFGILATFLLWQAQKYGRILLEKKFYRQKYDYKKALQDFSKLSARFTNRDSLAREVVTKISDIMHLKGAALAFSNNGSFNIRESVGLRQDCCYNVNFSPKESWVQELLFLRSSQAVDNMGVKKIFEGTGIQFLTPVVVQEHLEGIILLGEKHAEINYSKDDVELLDTIARQVSSAIETINLYKEVHEVERMKKELEIARKIQLSSLPAETPSIPGLDIAAISQPAQEVGGDFYDFLVRHDSITFILGDVSGKGTSAALYMSRVQGIIRSLDSYQPSLWELFVRLNNQVYGHIERKSYVTVLGMRTNLLDYSTSFIRAGHLPLIHYHAKTHSIEVYQPQGLGVGLDERQFSSSLVEQNIQPDREDVIVLFTDGISEALNTKDEEFGMQQIEKVILQNARRSSEEIKSAIIDSVNRFGAGAHQHDDMSAVVVKFV